MMRPTGCDRKILIKSCDLAIAKKYGLNGGCMRSSHLKMLHGNYSLICGIYLPCDGETMTALDSLDDTS